jgi:hypothetical protein
MSKKFSYIIFAFQLTIMIGGKLQAQPMSSSSLVVEGEKLYRDSKNRNLLYYLPPSYDLLYAADGRPPFTLIKMRYTGTAATGDKGVSKYHNLVQFRVGVAPDHVRQMNDLKVIIKRMYPLAELRMMPVRKFSSLLVFAGTAGADTAHLIQTGYAEPTDENSEVNNSYWNERVVSFRINNYDAQLVETALRNKQAAMSLSYAFYTNMNGGKNDDTSVYRDGRLDNNAKDFFRQQEDNDKDSSSLLAMVKADVIPIMVDVQRWPDAIQQTDINERIPAKYPLLDVYCYDFNNELRPDLYARKVEIKAVSVNGSEISTTFSFRQNKPDQYAKSIRFGYAIRLDKPYSFRVTEITNDGEMQTGEWTVRKEWSELLDITSPPDKVVLKQKAEDNQ